jgi:hypothetical protein
MSHAPQQRPTRDTAGAKAAQQQTQINDGEEIPEYRTTSRSGRKSTTPAAVSATGPAGEKGFGCTGWGNQIGIIAVSL